MAGRKKSWALLSQEQRRSRSIPPIAIPAPRKASVGRRHAVSFRTP